MTTHSGFWPHRLDAAIRTVPDRMDEVFALRPALKALRHRTAGTLSGGERKLLAIGKALMTRPPVLLLDEPTANLSPDLARAVLSEHGRGPAAGTIAPPAPGVPAP